MHMLSRRLGTFISNIIAIIAAFLIAYTFRFGWEPDDTFRNVNDALVLSYLIFCYVAVFMFYRGSKVSGRRGILRLIKESFLNTVFVAGLFASIVYMAHISDSIPRLFFGYFFSIFFCALGSSHKGISLPRSPLAMTIISAYLMMSSR